MNFSERRLQDRPHHSLARTVARHLPGVLLLVGVILTGRAEANTYYVSQQGNDANSCAAAQSEVQSSQKATISAGVACLSAGDTLYIHGGVYTGYRNTIDSQVFPVASGTSWSNPITIAGMPGEQVTLRPPNNVSAIKLTTGSPSFLIMQDFIVDMANSGPGADADAIFVYTAHHNRFLRLEVKNGWSFGIHFGDVTPFNEVLYCRIHDNGYPGSASTVGHGLYITGSDNLFEGNEVYNNQGYGFHIYNNHGSHADPSRNIIRKNRIYGNGVHGSPAYAVVVAWGSDNVITNNLVYGNRGGIQVYSGSSNTMVYNNTVYNNADEGIALQGYASGVTVRNNIAYANAVNIVDYGGGSAPVMDHNLTVDPRFSNPSAGDFSLRFESGARDAGANIGAVPDDIQGTARPQGGTHDIGAYEYRDDAGLRAPGNPRLVRN